MTEKVFEIGQVVVLTHTVEVNDEEVDPSTVVIDLRTPSGEYLPRAEWAGGAGVIDRDAEGVYVYEFSPTESGVWTFKWWADGTAKEAKEGSFWVLRSAFP